MSAHSAIYVGSVAHRRLAPRPHALRYRVFWLLLDLAELPAVAAKLRLFSYNRRNLFSFCDTDHGDGSNTPLRKQIERCLASPESRYPVARCGCSVCPARSDTASIR